MSERAYVGVIEGRLKELTAVMAQHRGGVAEEIKMAAIPVERPASELARIFVAIRLLLDEMNESVKLLEDTLNDLKTNVVPAAFEREHVTSFNTANGYRVTTSVAVRASIRADMKADAYAWLQQHGLGDIITPTVNASTLSAVAKKMMGDGIELDERFFHQYMQNSTSVTKI